MSHLQELTCERMRYVYVQEHTREDRASACGADGRLRRSTIRARFVARQAGKDPGRITCDRAPLALGRHLPQKVRADRIQGVDISQIENSMPHFYQYESEGETR